MNATELSLVNSVYDLIHELDSGFPYLRQENQLEYDEWLRDINEHTGPSIYEKIETAFGRSAEEAHHVVAREVVEYMPSFIQERLTHTGFITIDLNIEDRIRRVLNDMNEESRMKLMNEKRFV